MGRILWGGWVFGTNIYGFMRVKGSPEVTFITVVRGLCCPDLL